VPPTTTTTTTTPEPYVDEPDVPPNLIPVYPSFYFNTGTAEQRSTTKGYYHESLMVSTMVCDSWSTSFLSTDCESNNPRMDESSQNSVTYQLDESNSNENMEVQVSVSRTGAWYFTGFMEFHNTTMHPRNPHGPSPHQGNYCDEGDWKTDAYLNSMRTCPIEFGSGIYYPPTGRAAVKYRTTIQYVNTNTTGVRAGGNLNGARWWNGLITGLLNPAYNHPHGWIEGPTMQLDQCSELSKRVPWYGGCCFPYRDFTKGSSNEDVEGSLEDWIMSFKPATPHGATGFLRCTPTLPQSQGGPTTTTTTFDPSMGNQYYNRYCEEYPDSRPGHSYSELTRQPTSQEYNYYETTGWLVFEDGELEKSFTVTGIKNNTPEYAVKVVGLELIDTSGSMIMDSGRWPKLRGWINGERITQPSQSYPTGVLSYQIGLPQGRPFTWVPNTDRHSNTFGENYDGLGKWDNAEAKYYCTGCYSGVFPDDRQYPPWHGQIIYADNSKAEIKIRDNNPGAFAIGGWMSDGIQINYNPLSAGKYADLNSAYDLPPAQLPTDPEEADNTIATRPEYEGTYGLAGNGNDMGTLPGEAKAKSSYGCQYGTSKNSRVVSWREYYSLDASSSQAHEPIYQVWNRFAPNTGWGDSLDKGSLGWGGMSYYNYEGELDTVDRDQWFLGFDAEGRQVNPYQHDIWEDKFFFHDTPAENSHNHTAHGRTSSHFDESLYNNFLKSLFVSFKNRTPKDLDRYYKVPVPESGTNKVKLPVVRVGGADGAATVNYETFYPSPGSTAIPGVHYMPVSGTLNFADGEACKHIEVEALDWYDPYADPAIDPMYTPYSKSVHIKLSSPAGGYKNNASVYEKCNQDIWHGNFSSTGELHLLTIPDYTGRLELGNCNATAYEGPANQIPRHDVVAFADFTVYRYIFSPEVNINLMNGNQNTIIPQKKYLGGHGRVAVDYRTIEGTAKEHQDYIPASGTVIFEDGESVKTIRTYIVQEDILSGLARRNQGGAEEVNTIGEKYSLILENPSGVALVGANDPWEYCGPSGTVNIRETQQTPDDCFPVVAVWNNNDFKDDNYKIKLNGVDLTADHLYRDYLGNTNRGGLYLNDTNSHWAGINRRGGLWIGSIDLPNSISGGYCCPGGGASPAYWERFYRTSQGNTVSHFTQVPSGTHGGGQHHLEITGIWHTGQHVMSSENMLWSYFHDDLLLTGVNSLEMINVRHKRSKGTDPADTNYGSVGVYLCKLGELQTLHGNTFKNLDIVRTLFQGNYSCPRYDTPAYYVNPNSIDQSFSFDYIPSGHYGCIEPPEMLPFIVDQPSSIQGYVGSNVQLSAETIYGMSYKWFKDNDPLQGNFHPDSGILSLNNLQMSDAGVYEVHITNWWGEIVSSGATVYVQN